MSECVSERVSEKVSFFTSCNEQKFIWSKSRSFLFFAFRFSLFVFRFSITGLCHVVTVICVHE